MSEELGLRDWINFAILILTLAAIVAGPLWAVHLTKLVDETKERRARQFKIFHELMRTRKAKLSFDHVSALNIVQIEYYGSEKIIAAYQAYIQKLNTPPPKEPEAAHHHFKDWDDAFFTMLNEMGVHLGYQLDKRDLERFSYAPQGWDNDESQNRQFRHLMIQMLQGERGVPITNFTGATGKYPPPPEGQR